MSLADELLSVLTANLYTEEHITIGIDRYITVPNSLKRLAVQYDHNIETVTFDCPRYWDGRDLSTMHVFINYIRRDKTTGSSLATNIMIDELDDNIMHFDWTIDGNVTEVEGKLSFLVCVKKTDDDGNKKNVWHSELYTETYISEGVQCDDYVAQLYPDVITQILTRIDTLETNGGGSGEIGTIDRAEVEQIIADYLEANPPAQGEPGEDGHTPVKGVDYFTDEDISLIAEEAAKLVEIPSIEQLDAEKVFFNSDLVTTHAIGNIALSNGQATIPAVGKNLKEVWNSIFVQEQNPVTTQPSVSLTVPQGRAYEVGTKITPSYSATLSPGSYSYGPATGITATAWEVTDTAGNTANTASGNFSELQVVDGISYKIKAKATHGDGTIPVTNIGNVYPDGQIKAGTKSATSSVAITGYRNSFYGTLTEKSDLTSDAIRGLTKSGKALANGNSFTVTVPVGALRVAIAYPATLRDITSIKDVNGMNAEISSGFAKSIIAVEGMNNYDTIDYKVYTMDFASANDTANKLTVTI